MTLIDGLIAGRYSLDREIGRGGMGAVWLGRDEVLGRQVALKKIGLAPGGSSPDLLRAEREARLAARLNHPHVVAIFDLVDEDDQQWLVMEYVEGSTLAELVRASGPLAPDQAAAIMLQAAEALAAAHQAGIVHRDVKPSNILVTPDGRVKLSDFGIARAEADASLTQTGLVTGSPAYISPEVASGRMATDLSDVWSLGATLFHAMAGSPPYDIGDNVIGGLYRIVHEEPPRLDNAGWLAPLLESSMTIDPGGRWSMGEVVDFLRAGPDAPIPRPRDRTGGALAADTASSSTQVLSKVMPQAVPAAATDRGTHSSRPGRAFPILIAVLVIALLSVIGVLIVLNGGNDEGPPATADTSSTPPTTSGTNTPAPGPTAEALEDFARTYVATASSNPTAGFALLTPEYQAESPKYDEVWTNITDPEILDVSADVDALQVRYTYRYDYSPGNSGKTETKTEDVTLFLKLQEDGTFLISGAK